jgi:hypothetical protein
MVVFEVVVLPRQSREFPKSAMVTDKIVNRTSALRASPSGAEDDAAMFLRAREEACGERLLNADISPRSDR